MGSHIGEIALIAVLIVLNGFFAAAEIALISARRVALKNAADKGSAGAPFALRLVEDPSRLLSTIQVAITLSGFLASAAAAATLAQPLAGWLRSLGVPALSRVAAGVAVFITTLAISYFSIVLGELVPKRIGLNRSESVAIALARPLWYLSAAAAPLVWLLARSTDLVSRLFGVRGHGRPGVSEEEIKLLVTEQGTLLDEEKRMIHEIFELGDTVAREVMVPRVDVVAIDENATLRAAVELFLSSGFSRLPVFRDDVDTVVGVLLLRDLVAPASEGAPDAPIAPYVRPPVFVPETKRILALLSEMRARRNHLAIVVDEYGGTAGLVTIEDIVEEVIGEVADEFDRERRHIIEIGPNEWVLDGRLSVEEAQEMLGLPVPESDAYETVAGWLLMELGHIPVPGESVALEGYTVQVQAVRRRRIARVRVAETEPEGDEGGSQPED